MDIFWGPDAREQDDACMDATNLERRLRAMGQGNMGWSTHKEHVFFLPLEPEDDNGGGNARRQKKKKQCCSCCNPKRRCRNSHQVQARWDNNKVCFVPIYRERDYNFGSVPLYYRYMGVEDGDRLYAGVAAMLVLIVFLVIVTVDGYNKNWHHHDNDNGPALAAWVLLIACGGLLLISMCACCVCSLMQQMQNDENDNW